MNELRRSEIPTLTCTGVVRALTAEASLEGSELVGVVGVVVCVCMSEHMSHSER